MRAHPLLLALLLFCCAAPPSSTNEAVAHDAAVDARAAPDAAVDATPAKPDLSIDVGRSRVDLSIATESFAADSCELDPNEECVDAEGDRRLLRFSVETINLGDADLVLGSPGDEPGFAWSACHGHFHFEGYANYRLLRDDGSEAVRGRKQAFCLLDSEPYTANASNSPFYTCLYQGLQAGWADVYTANLPCQYLDITGVPDGDYTLEIDVNPEGQLADESSLNNLGTVALRIGDPELETPTEACPILATRYLNRLERECEWELAGEFDCTPGDMTGAGCSQNCGMGSCTGDPMIRICDAEEENCTSGVALEDNNNRCGGLCPLATQVVCPASGRLAIYTASADYGQPYTCNVVVGLGPLVP
jgi:hypothetical protein